MEIKYLEEVLTQKTMEERAETEECVYNVNKKKLFIAYPLVVFLGSIGVHRFYLGHKRAAYFFISLTGLSFFGQIYSSVFDNTAGQLIVYLMIPIGIALVYDFIRLPFLVNKHNVELRNQIETYEG